MKKGAIVYSTDPDWKGTCPVCEQPLDSCTCENHAQKNSKASKFRIRKEKKGRAGKTVTIISGLSGDLKKMQKELQRLCGAGGTLKERVIEIQGDQVEKIRAFLEGKSVKSKG